MTIVLCICSFILSLALGIAGHGLDSWVFWVVLACYITALVCALIREQTLLKRIESLEQSRDEWKHIAIETQRLNDELVEVNTKLVELNEELISLCKRGEGNENQENYKPLQEKRTVKDF